MINKIKHIVKKNKVIEKIIRILMYPYFKFNYKKSDKEAQIREKSPNINQKYKWILDLKEKHIGERCFVIATGPSLTIDDLEILKDEVTFSMNSILYSFDKTKWRPSYYMIQDEYVYDSLKDIIKNKNMNEICISENVEKLCGNTLKHRVFPLHYLDHKIYHKNGYGEIKFSKNCYATVYDDYSIVFSILQFACYMGFKEIYLLGCDCNYNQDKKHFVDYRI